MFLFAHEGHEHTDKAVQAVTTDKSSVDPTDYTILAIGLILLVTGVVLFVTAFSKKSKRSKKAEGSEQV